MSAKLTADRKLSSVEESAPSRVVSFAAGGDLTSAASAEKTRKREEEQAKIRLEDEGQRKEFGNNVDALVSIIANAVGLGNVWRFPYICYKSGGGAFFIAYLLMLILVAMPILDMELAWGQFTEMGAAGSWNVVPLLRGAGYAGSGTNIIMNAYSAVLIAYALFYLVMSGYSLKDINDPFWNGCDNAWSFPDCLTLKNLSAEISKKKNNAKKVSYAQKDKETSQVEKKNNRKINKRSLQRQKIC